MYKLSIIIPVLNESSQIEHCLNKLQELRQKGHEVIVVDGGSVDETVTLAAPLSDSVVQSKKSRSIQMNTGAHVATGECFLFLHADTLLPENVNDIFSKQNNLKTCWGRFDIKLSGKHFLFKVIAKCMNARSRISGIATGDQVIFIGSELFKEIGGFPEIALMEDIAMSSKLLKKSKPICLKDNVISSSRRWEQYGIVKTILKMWLLRFLYYFNVDTNKLAKIYS